MKYAILSILLILGFCANAQEENQNHHTLPTQEITVNLPFIGQKTITVSQDGGDLLFEGDIVIQQGGGSGRGGATIANASDDALLWDNSIIPYVIAENHPKRSDILQAINQLNATTNLCVRPRTFESDYIEIIYEAGKCGSSPVGKRGGKQTVKVGNRCGNTIGSTMHEILHSSGFWHEQSREDRDDYVEIILDNVNVTSDSDPRHNFDKYSRGTDIGNYDYASIMHYGRDAFGKPDPDDIYERMHTIRPLTAGVTIGQRNSLSEGDIAAVNDVYPIQPDGCDVTFTESGRGGSEDQATGDDGVNTDETDDNTSWPASSNSSFDIRYEVELVPQQTGMSCWAAGAAMIVGWRDRVCIDPSEIASGIGYWAQYSQGLDANDVNMFEYWGLAYEAPQTYTVEGFVDLLRRYGPLWVATHEGAPHIRVVAGIAGDGTPTGTILTIFDPWQRGMRRFRPNNTGSTYTETYQEFERKQRELGEREMNEPNPYYVAHN